MLFIDEFDALCTPRSDQGENMPIPNYLVRQLCVGMCGVDAHEGMIVMAATNRLNMVDPALRHVAVELPTPEGRVNILRTLSKFCSYFLRLV